MRPTTRTLLLIIAAAVPVSCATVDGPRADAEAHKAAMRADRMALAYNVESMEQLREAGRHGQRSLQMIRAAANAPLERRAGILQRARRQADVAGSHVVLSDHLSALATEREKVEDLSALLWWQLFRPYVPVIPGTLYRLERSHN